MGAYWRWALIRGWALIKLLDLESGRLFEAGRLLTFPIYRVGAYSRWALIRINTVIVIWRNEGFVSPFFYHRMIAYYLTVTITFFFFLINVISS